MIRQLRFNDIEQPRTGEQVAKNDWHRSFASASHDQFVVAVVALGD
jgi:hypothetical protein